MSLPDTVVIGETYRFAYPKEFVTLPHYVLKRGALVTVLRPCTEEEADQGGEMERMFHISTPDGWEGVAWASELHGETCDTCARRAEEVVPVGTKRNLVVDGTDNVSGQFMGDGTLPPFVVFDVDAQENIAGPFETRDEAEQHRLEILAGAEPKLDAPKLMAWIEKIDEERS